MFKSNHAYLIVILIFTFFSCNNQPLYTDAIAITNVNVIDAENGLQESKTVIVQDNKISLISDTDDVKLGDNSQVIDGKGKYLIPGFWDAHVHFAYLEDLAPSMFDLFLMYGITSVRDTGGKIGFVNKWKALAQTDPKNAPRVKIAGPLIDGMPNVYDGSSPQRPELSVGAATPEAAAQIVADLDAKGVDFIKAYEMLSPEQFKAVTAEATKRGLKVTGHIPLSMDVISASDAGLNSMEHLRNIEMSCANNSEQLMEQRRVLLRDGRNDQGGILRSRIHNAQRRYAIQNQNAQKTTEVLAALKRNDTWQIPTLSIAIASTHRPFLNSDWQKDFQYLPTAIESKWNEGVAMVAKSEISDERQAYTDWANGMVDKINKAKIPIMAGTDTPIFFLTPGRSLHDELALLVAAGMSPLEVLASATALPAAYFGLEDQLGLIKKDMIADLILLNANPLVDINNTMAIDIVLKDGNLIRPNELRAKLLEAKK
ncbi:MAG: imidazolonepropionase-like amidohydrolase [Saprospiraceae bacterium]|jgi:imidazolonepropionase-like amidohydrolase